MATNYNYPNENCCFSPVATAPLELPSDIPADILSFAFSGGECTDDESQTVDSALLWIETHIIDRFNVCAIASVDDCSVLQIQNGAASPVTALEAMQCIPFTSANQVVQYNGQVAAIGFPEFQNIPTWLTLNDTYPYQTTTYIGFAGGLPIVTDDEVGLNLVNCLPTTSICPSDTASDVLRTLLDDNAELNAQWIAYASDVADAWTELEDTFTGTDDETTFAGTSGYLPIVLPDESGLQLSDCLPLSSVCPGNENQLIQVLPSAEDPTVMELQYVNCLAIASICPGDDGQLLQTLDDPNNPGTLVPQWVDCLDPQYICPGNDNQALQTVLNAVTNELEATWVDVNVDGTWLGLSDTFTGTADETTFTGTAGLIPVSRDDGTGIELGCLPASSICPGDDGQLIQTLDSGGTLVPQWIDCLPVAQICPGADTQIAVSRDDGTGEIIPTWENNNANTWLGLSDTFTGTADETTFTGTAGLIPVSRDDGTGIELGCLPVSSICPGADSQLIQTLDDPNNPGTLVPQWVNCLPVAQICPSTVAADVVTSVDDGTGTVTPQWQALAGGIDNWLGLNDTFTNTGDETSYAGTTGFLPIVGTTAGGDTGMILNSCLPQSSICPGTDGQLIQTLDDPNNPGTLVPQWVDCLPIAQICPSTVAADVVTSVNDGTGNITSQWQAPAAGVDNWLGLNDTFTNTGNETSYAGTAGFLPIVGTTAGGDTGMILNSCLPQSSICPGTDGQLIQTLDDPANPGTLVPQWVDCLPIAQICPSTVAADVVTSVNDGTGNITSQWQAPAAGVDNWLGLNDTFTETGDETSYAGTTGFIPIVGTTAAGDTGMILNSCLPVSSICPGTDGQLIQTLDDPNNPGTLVPQWVDCLPVAQICPSDEGCDRLISRTGTVQWGHDVWVNLCDTIPQTNADNSATAATIANYYAGWTGALASRVNVGETGQEFVSQQDPNAPPIQGQVLTHDFDDGFTEVYTRYATPYQFSDHQWGDDSNDFYIYPFRNPNTGETEFIGLPTINPFNPGTNILEGEDDGFGTPLLDVDAFGFSGFNAFPGSTGYVITKDGRYQICFRGYFRGVLPNNANAAIQDPNVSVDFTLFMATFRQSATPSIVDYALGSATWNIGSTQAQPGMQFTEFIVGCVTQYFEVGDVIQLFVQATDANGTVAYADNQDEVDQAIADERAAAAAGNRNPNIPQVVQDTGNGFLVSFQHDGATGFTATEILGWG